MDLAVQEVRSRANSKVAGEALPASEGVVDCSALGHIERAAGFGFGMPHR
jgi:hypothetical protein